MFKLLDSAFGLVGDVAKIAEAPVRVAVDAARVVTAPIADAAEQVADAVSEEIEGHRD